MACCCVFVWSLHSQPPLSDRVSRRNRHIVTTVLILTVIFIVCCSTLIIVWVYYDKLEGGISSLRTAAAVQYTIYNLLPILNSALNPVVLIARGRTLRNYVAGRWTRSLIARSLARSLTHHNSHFSRATADKEDRTALSETETGCETVNRDNVMFNNRAVDPPVSTTEL